MIFDIFCLYLVTGPYHIQQPKIPSTVLSIIQVFFHHLPSLHGAARWHGVVWVGWPVQKIRVEVLGSYHCFKRFRMLAHGFIVWFHIAQKRCWWKWNSYQISTLCRDFENSCIWQGRCHGWRISSYQKSAMANWLLQNTQPLALHFLDKLPETKS